MVRVDIAQMSMDGTWIDGYLPAVEEMKQLARSYQAMDRSGAYGLRHARDQEELFGSMAGAFRGRFDSENLPPDVRPTPCFMWLFRTDRESHDPRMKALYEEHLADSRRADYFHLVSIHDECPVAEACLQEVLKRLRFQEKLEDAYAAKNRFRRSTQELLSHYVEIMASPWLEVERLLRLSSSGFTSAGP